MLLPGISLGFLSFTKGEGAAAAFTVFLLIICYLFYQRNRGGKTRFHAAYFLTGLFISALPTIIFYIAYAPQNQTFINGFLSKAHPVNVGRLKIILYFLWFELINKKWSGIWVLLLAGLIIGGVKCLKKNLLIIPAFLGIYGLAVIFYYFINTYFEIGWWLSVSLSRILFSILPVTIFWVFYSLWREERT